ncbi:uncharacterized protein EV420DRAFT_1645192 [Desarmillaria tabescens]|uniref:Uncharacterized protein n=1 Tax=Armillaria tabescens TaxID=1929756 RepID=A0AA39N1F6_ARMTA|nr:uncharacterized protein EV420DRAFT_1645192 [Desarmillaria tabescens]KAK0453978.1 hypothetical protein EV420DRAFT_1645192 [Desarmillaria tabescens]
MANAEELVNDYETRIQKILWEVNDKGKTVGRDDKIPPNNSSKYHEPDMPCVMDIETVFSSQCSAPAHSEELNAVGEADASDAGRANGPILVTSSFLRLVVEIAHSMDRALQRENHQYSRDHPSERGIPTPPRPRREFDPLDDEGSDVDLLQQVTENWNTDEENNNNTDDIPSFYSASHASDDEEWESNNSFGTNES